MTDTTEQPIIYRGRCPWDQACHGCQIEVHDGETFVCPIYPERTIKGKQARQRNGDPFAVLDKLFAWQEDKE